MTRKKIKRILKGVKINKLCIIALGKANTMRIHATFILMTLIGCSAHGMQKTVGNLTIDFTDAQIIGHDDTSRVEWPNGSMLVLGVVKGSNNPCGHYSDHSNSDSTIILNPTEAQQWWDALRTLRQPASSNK